MAIALEGTVQTVVVDRAIARMTVAGAEPVKIIGELGTLIPGETVRVEGEWEMHPRYGRQLRVHSVTPVVPTTEEGVARYLGSGLIPGIGPDLAGRIVARLGKDAIAILERDPGRIAEVPGIGPKRAAAVRETLSERRAAQEMLLFLHGLRIPSAFGARILRRYGGETIQRVRENPYRLAREVPGIGFVTADRIARELGFTPESGERIEAGLLHVLWQARGDGHVLLVRAELSERAVRMLGVPLGQVAPAIERLRATGELILEGDDVFEPVLARAERELAGALAALAVAPRSARFRPPRPHPEELSRLEGAQRRAVERACSERLAIVTGGPGTGKTTIVRAVVRAYAAAGLRVELAAPTGRAAKRLAEATGHPARTVHRLLAWDGRKFVHGPGAELAADLVVIDEASMLDLELGCALARAVAPGATLLLVGDVDQLPSVGPGQVLRDLIQSGAFEVVRLTEIFRQARESRIVRSAHAINAGVLPEIARPEEAGDFFFVRADDPARARAMVVRLVEERIPARFGLDPMRDVQVLAPMRRGEAGTIELSRALQQALNPDGRTRVGAGRSFREGDKVIQLRNDYDRDVFNGDVGRVAAIGDDEMTVDIDGRAIVYPSEDWIDLDLAYALTVHRAQGSEYPAVVMPILTQHFVMLQRNLLYTAVTRARRLCVLVGSERALALAVRNQETRARQTRLAERLRAPTSPSAPAAP
jgi:exodeoxyribonuclease V alpha subunit